MLRKLVASSPVDLAQNNIQRSDYRNHVRHQMPETKLSQGLEID
jgi:hypothetical protein